jgi:outer membrane receptor for ferrienterochelin and colicins
MSKRVRVVLGVVYLFFALAVQSFSSVLGNLEGIVVDKETREPLYLAHVVVRGLPRGASVDEGGGFSIPRLPAGKYKIVASMMGYNAVTKEIVVWEGETSYLEFELVQSPIGMGGVVVTGTRTSRYVKDIPVRTEVLTRKAIEEKGAANLYEALEGVRGIRVEQQCQYCNFSMVRLQGLGADHTQVLIDGQPVYSGLASVYGLQQLGVANIDRIEVVKGAGSALYGPGAVAGGINIITQKPAQKPDSKVGIELGSYNTNKYSFSTSMRKDNIGLTLFAQKHIGDAIDQTSDGVTSGEVKQADGVSDRVSADATDASFSVIVDNIFGDDQFTATGKVLYELRHGGVLDDNVYENPFTEGTERIITNRHEVMSKYKKDFFGGNQINISLAYVRHHRNATNDTYLGDYMAVHGDTLPPLDDMRPYLATEDVYVVNFDYLQPLFGKHRLLTGIQYSHNKLEETGKYVVVDEYSPNYGEPYTSISEKHANEVGIYLQDEFAISGALEIIAGIRGDIHQSEDNFRGSGKVAPEGVPPVKYDETALNPRFAIKYEPFQSFVLRGSVGTGFRVPYGFSEDLHLCSGSPRVWKGEDLEAEKSISFNLSLDYEVGDRVFLNANFFRTNLKNKIGFTEASEAARSLGYTYEWENIDNAYVQGIELGGDFLIVESLVFNLDLTFNDGQYEHVREDWIGTSFQDKSKYISRFPRYSAGTKLRFTPTDWNFVLEGDYQGPMYIDYFKDEEEPTKIKETEPYLILNVKASRSLFDKFTFFMGAKNLTNYIQPEKHTDDAAFMYAPLYGRIVYGGLEIGL